MGEVLMNMEGVLGIREMIREVVVVEVMIVSFENRE